MSVEQFGVAFGQNGRMHTLFAQNLSWNLDSGDANASINAECQRTVRDVGVEVVNLLANGAETVELSGFHHAWGGFPDENAQHLFALNVDAIFFAEAEKRLDTLGRWLTDGADQGGGFDVGSRFGAGAETSWHWIDVVRGTGDVHENGECFGLTENVGASNILGKLLGS